MLTFWLASLVALASPQGQASPGGQDARPPSPEVLPIWSNIDREAAGRCMGSMVGFRNVPVRCVVGSDGRLGQCEVQTTDDRVRRYQRVFSCMAAAMTVINNDGSSAEGESVAFRLNGRSLYLEPEAATDADAP